MIICICNNVTEAQIRELQHLPIEDVMLKSGAAMCCGCCFEILQKTLDEVPLGKTAKPTGLSPVVSRFESEVGYQNKSQEVK